MSDFFNDYDDTQQSSSSYGSSSGGGSAGGGGYANELFSKQIHTKLRRFFIDLKESQNGKYVKMSEKSNGRKSTIMFDVENIDEIIEALQEVKKHV
jgi:hypothetical protein